MFLLQLDSIGISICLSLEYTYPLLSTEVILSNYDIYLHLEGRYHIIGYDGYIGYLCISYQVIGIGIVSRMLTHPG